MFSTWWPRRLKTKSPFSRRAAARGADFHPRLEVLEERVLLAMVIWDSRIGTPHMDDRWSNPFNWVNSRLPRDGDDVLIVADQLASRGTSVNNIVGLELRSITTLGNVEVSGEAIGLEDGIVVGSFGAEVLWATPINLTSHDDARVDVASGSLLTLSGDIRDESRFDKGLRISGNVVLSGHNIYYGTHLDAGVLTILDPSALGIGETFVASGAVVQLFGGIGVVFQRQLKLNGTGLFGSGALISTGSNGWSDSVEMESSTSVNVASGDLTLSGVIGGSANWEKRGAGPLVLDGDNHNTFTGSLTVREGTLNLNKLRRTAVTGPLIIGDGVGGPDADQVRLFRSEQIGNNVPVTISSSGLLDLNSQSTGVGPLVMTGSRVSMGAGILSLFGDVTATSAPNGTPARIDGNLFLGNADRTFTIPDGPGDVELAISAPISPASGASLIKAGTGTMRLTGNSINYRGQMDISRGRLLVDGMLPSSPVIVIGGTLGGNGTVGRLTVGGGGTLDPGAGATLDVSGTVGLVSFATFVAHPITGALTATGNVNLGSGARLVVNLSRGEAASPPPLNVPIRIIGGNGVSGRFSNAADGAILPVNIRVGTFTGTLLFRITYTANAVFLTRIPGPMFQNRAVTSPTNEGGLATLTGTITTPDPGDTFFLEVNWGDGSRTETHRFGPHAPRTVSLTHRYRDDNPSGTPSDNYTIELLWRDQRGAQNTGTLLATVNNVPPAVDAGPAAVVLQNTILARPVSFADPGADTWAATVDYGDGSGVQPLAIGPASRFTLLWHRYDTPGTYTARVTVTDDDGGTGTDSFVVTVRPWWPFLGIGAQLPLSAEDIADDGLGVASALVPEPGQSASGLHPLEGNRIDLDRAALDRFFQLAAENTPRSRAIRVEADSLADGLDDDLLEALISGFPRGSAPVATFSRRGIDR